MFIDYDDKILVGGKNTTKLLSYLGPILLKYPFLADFYLETVMVLHLVADNLGFTIYIPSIWKGLMLIFKFILGGGKGGKGPAGCSPEDKHNKSSSEPFSTTKPDSNFKSSEILSKSRKENHDEVLKIISSRRSFFNSFTPLDWEARRFSKDEGIVCLDFMMPITKFRGNNLTGCLDIKECEILDLLEKIAKRSKK